MNKVSRQISYVPVVYRNKEIKIKQPYFDGNAYLTVPEPRHILRA